MSLVRNCITACTLAAALLLGAGFAGAPASATETAAPTAPNSSSRVMPLPAGQWSWSAEYGVAGPMWSSGHHTGIDLSASTGTSVLAAAAGVVIFAGEGGAYGNLTQIQHSGGIQTWYAHQSEISVSVGAAVVPGQVIGSVGATGNTTGPHLHFEVRVDGAHADPRPWLAGAQVTAGTTGQAFDSALASQLRGDLADAEATQVRAQQEVVAITRELAKVSRHSAGIAKSARQARQYLITSIRNVYKLGLDPQWLINIEALEAGDWRTFSDRRVISEYTTAAQNHRYELALQALKRAEVHRLAVTNLQSRARAALLEAQTKMADVQRQLAESSGAVLAGTQFDGIVPPGGSAQAQAAAKFALSQVGSPYTRAGGTGPEYGCNGFAWRSWHEAGSSWPEMMANQQATNGEWVAPVAPGAEKVGDLVFWRMNNGTDLPGLIDHVGIVVNPEQGLFVHPSSPCTGGEANNYRSSSYYRDVAQFGRVLR